jgi:hypothetical protein
VSGPECANCGAPLTGPYCAECGQHAHESSRAIGTLLHDAWHIVTHVDSRFWRTIGMLLANPGTLTREYFAERRARYLPPFRLYLVLSLIFFALASLTGAGSHRARDPDATRGASAEASAKAATDAPDAPDAAAELGEAGSDLNFDLKDCDHVEAFGWRWLERPLTDACRRAAADHGRSAAHAFIANIPKMMFVFLPLMALFMLLLYWRPRRYYVEHLVYFLHTHSALFLVFILQMLAGLAMRPWPALRPAVDVVQFGVSVYAVWYVYRSMRVYYGQRRSLTAIKIFAVGFVYFVFLSMTLLGTLLVSALTA